MEIQNRSITARRPDLPSREVDQLRATLRNQLVTGSGQQSSISRRFAPSAAERNALTQRRQQLAHGLMPGSREEAAVAIAAMFMAFPAAKMTPQEARETAAVYVAQVQELPSWAVKDGCAHFRARPSPYPPSAGELFAVCSAAVRWARDELAQIEAILRAEVVADPDQAQRARNVERARALVAQMGSGRKDRGGRQPTSAEAQSWLDRELAKVPAEKISDEFRRQYGSG